MAGTLARRAAGVLPRRYIGYAGASVIALGVDVVTFLLVLSLSAPPAPSAALGYASGILVHWLITSRLVFADRTGAVGTSRRNLQGVAFAASALLGLFLTWGVVAFAVTLGVPAVVGKALAIVVSFQAVWIVRNRLVFAASR